MTSRVTSRAAAALALLAACLAVRCSATGPIATRSPAKEVPEQGILAAEWMPEQLVLGGVPQAVMVACDKPGAPVPSLRPRRPGGLGDEPGPRLCGRGVQALHARPSQPRETPAVRAGRSRPARGPCRPRRSAPARSSAGSLTRGARRRGEPVLEGSEGGADAVELGDEGQAELGPVSDEGPVVADLRVEVGGGHGHQVVAIGRAQRDQSLFRIGPVVPLVLTTVKRS